MTGRAQAGPAAAPPLFVYGTLRPGLTPEPLRARLVQLTVLGPARTRGHLVDLGAYPGAVPDAVATEWIHGELLALPEPERAWAWMDPYEGYDPADPRHSLFVRTRVLAVGADGLPTDCWIYAYNGDPAHLPRVAGGDWMRRKPGPRAG